MKFCLKNKTTTNKNSTVSFSGLCTLMPGQCCLSFSVTLLLLLTNSGAQPVAAVLLSETPADSSLGSPVLAYHLAFYMDAREPNSRPRAGYPNTNTLSHLPSPIHHFFNGCLLLTFMSVGRLCKFICGAWSVFCYFFMLSGSRRKPHR